MPEFRKMSARDADSLFLKRGQMDLREYEEFLAKLSSGDVAEVKPDDGETERALKRRLTVAAKGQGKQVQYSKRAPAGSIGMAKRKRPYNPNFFKTPACSIAAGAGAAAYASGAHV